MSKKKKTSTTLTVVKPDFTNIRIKDRSIEETTREATEDQWDRDDTATYHYIDEIEIVGDDDYNDLVVPFKVNPNESYYLLSVVYSTGDSFGRDDGRIEHIELYSDKKLAEANATAIEEHYKNHKQNYFSNDKVELIITNQSGKKYACYCSWMGYFEYIQEATVTGVTVKSEGDHNGLNSSRY
jgi:hypothetical protein